MEKYSKPTRRVKSSAAQTRPTLDRHAQSAHNPNQLQLPFTDCAAIAQASDAVARINVPQSGGSNVPPRAGVYSYLRWLGR